MSDKTEILDSRKILRKIERIAYEIYEEHFNEKELTLIGVAPKGTELARRLRGIIEEISPVKVAVHRIKLNKDAPNSQKIELEGEAGLEGKVVILVDDVLNSGRTLMHAAAYVLRQPVKSLYTAVLVDRKHRLFPIRANFVGLTLSTTLQQHISVKLAEGSELAYLD